MVCSTFFILVIISNGGVKPNIIPKESELRVQIRCPTLPDFKRLMSKTEACCNAAATAAGCQVETSIRMNNSLVSLVSLLLIPDIIEMFLVIHRWRLSGWRNLI